MNKNLFVKKKNVDVTIFSKGGESRKGQIFLSLSSRFHRGRETIIELLRNEQPFLILKTESGVSFFNKNYIQKILIPEEEAELLKIGGEKEEEVVLNFPDGESMKCVINFAPKPNKSRLSDFLMEAPAFFPVYKGDEIYIVNREQIISVNPGGGNA